MKRAAPVFTLLAVLLGSGLALAQDPPTAETFDEASDQDQTQTQAEAQTDQDAASDDTVAETPARRPPYVDLRRVASIDGDAAAGAAKSELCSTCHGPEGISIAPSFPNLAGQSADFMYWQLVEYKRGVNTSPMTPLVADLSEQDMRDLSFYYASLPAGGAPSPGQQELADAADPEALQTGEHLFRMGDPARGIPACQGCHGADARGPAASAYVNPSGHRPYAGYPALRGQQLVYLQTKLGEYRDGEMADSTSDFVMTGVARDLDDEAIQALSSWLSSLPASQ